MARATCERCGEPLPKTARFCPNCGFYVAAPPPEERKVVTVIFVDLVGSTRLSAQVDPERYREVIAGYYRTVSEELESLRGRAYNFAGDAVVGVFGLTQTHEDDAVRAVRAGLALVERVGRLGDRFELPESLRIRVGIATGPVAIGSETSDQGLLFGATVNLAARLQQAADPGTVLVSDRTWLLTKDQVEYLEPRDVAAKGFDDAARAWTVTALGPASTRRTIPFVDRKRELRLLHDAFDGAAETRRGHLVSLFGEPGIGKTRVAEEFLANLPDGVRVLSGRASWHEEDATFAPLAQMLAHQLGERPNADPARLLGRLEELAAECCPADEIGRVAARLGLALGIGDDSPGDDGRYRAAEIRAGLVTLLDGLSRSGPVVLVFEDLNQAQPPMLDLIEQVVRDAHHLPLLVLCMTRYDLLDDRPDWGGGLGDSLNLYLEAMALEDGTELAQEAGDHLDRITAERVARHAGGNPFFIVETIGMLRHAESHLPADTDSLPEQLLPPTVQAVIAARIDHLPPAARDLVRTASVFGRSRFEESELSLVADPDRESLELLEDEELLIPDEDQPGTWRFRHGLVRDVAYDTLLKRERQRLHLLVADGLSADPETAARYPRSIAEHLERAARAGLDLNPGDRTLAERAVAALAHAGELALRGSDTRVAADLLGRAMSMSGPERSWSTREATILARLGEALYWQGEFDRAQSALERALALAPKETAVVAQAGRFLGDVHLSVRADRDRAAELFERALAASRELGDPLALARTLLVAGWGPYFRNDLDQARAMFREALEVARANAEGDPWSEARALASLSNIVSETGDEEEGLALASQGLAIAEGRGDRFSVATAHENVAGALRRMGKLDEAIVHADAAVTEFRDLGARWELASSLTSRGIARRLSGHGDEAVGDLREAFRLCRELKERSIVSWTASYLAKALTDLGELGRARRVLAEAGALAGDRSEASVDWLLDAEVEILLAEGDREGALEKALLLLDHERERGRPKDIASQVWWIGRVFGAEAVGGPEELDRARALLEELHLDQALRRPDLLAAR